MRNECPDCGCLIGCACPYDDVVARRIKLERVVAAAKKTCTWLDDPDAMYDDESEADQDELRAALADLDEETK